jgi:acyl-homoserine lactone acylase PvdQ
MWQLNFMRHLSSGRLAEILGPDGYDLDVAMRMFGHPQKGKKMAEMISGDDLEM